MNKLFISLFLAVVFLSGCAAILPKSVNEIPLTYISDLDNNAGFAASPGGDTIVYSYRGLKLLETSASRKRSLAKTEPDYLAWSQDGHHFASASNVDDATSRVTIFSRDGTLIDDYDVPSVLSGLKWTAQGDLLATGYLLKVYSFGSNLRQSLFKFSEGQFAEIQLTDTTLKPATSKMVSPVMKKVLPVLFSAYGDELAYVRLHDPPEFPPYVALLYRNWQVSGERVLQKFPLQALQVRAGNGEDELEVLSRDGLHVTRLRPERPERSMDRPYRFIDGRLIQEGVELANWEEGSHFQLLNDGHYLLGIDNKLYLGVGLQTVKIDHYNEKIWSLRRWRHEGLVSDDEYHQMLKELSP